MVAVTSDVPYRVSPRRSRLVQWQPWEATPPYSSLLLSTCQEGKIPNNCGAEWTPKDPTLFYIKPNVSRETSCTQQGHLQSEGTGEGGQQGGESLLFPHSVKWDLLLNSTYRDWFWLFPVPKIGVPETAPIREEYKAFRKMEKHACSPGRHSEKDFTNILHFFDFVFFSVPFSLVASLSSISLSP